MGKKREYPPVQVFRPIKNGRQLTNYYVRVRIGNKEILRSSGLSEQRAAEAWAKRYVAELKGIQSATGLAEKILEIRTGGRKVSLADALKIYMAKPSRRKRGKVREKLIRSVWADFSAWAESKGAGHLAQVSESVAEGWVGHIRQHGRFVTRIEYRGRQARKAKQYERAPRKLSADSVNEYQSIASMVVEAAMRDAGMPENPFARIDPVAKSAARRHAFSPEEIARVLDAADGFVRPLVVVAASTGMRLGDCCQLQWEAVDLVDGWIRVVMSKTGRLVRVPLLPGLRAMLTEMAASRSGDDVFPAQAAMYRVNDDGVSYRIGKALDAAGVRQGPGIRDFHSFRHAFIWSAAQAGIPMPVVQAMVGHLTPAMTQLYADHATDEATKRAITRLPDPLAAATKQPAAPAALDLAALSPSDLSSLPTDALLAEIARRMGR